MTAEQKRKLLKAQQGELDAVILYKNLAKIVKNNDLKNKFLKIASDEGHHAAILKEYTGEVLKPKSTNAIIITIMYKLLGQNFILNVLANGEIKSIDKYDKLAKDFPNINKIIKDEKAHAEISRSFIDK